MFQVVLRSALSVLFVYLFVVFHDVPDNRYKSHKRIWGISGSRYGVNEIGGLLEFYAALNGSFISTFRNNVSGTIVTMVPDTLFRNVS
jgi:hypothetical protein